LCFQKAPFFKTYIVVWNSPLPLLCKLEYEEVFSGEEQRRAEDLPVNPFPKVLTTSIDVMPLRFLLVCGGNKIGLSVTISYHMVYVHTFTRSQ
jgi:hypothetical protein